MPPIRAEHGLSWRKGNSSHAVGPVASVGGSVDGDERAKQPRRSGVSRRHSPSHSRTPSPNNQQIPSASGIPVHLAAHGHVFAHGTRRSPSSKAAGSGVGSARVGGGGGAAFVADGVLGGSSSREKRRNSPDSARKGCAHAHTCQRTLGGKSPAFGPPLKSSARSSAAGSSWGVSSPTPAVGGAGGGGSSAISSPTQPTASSGRGRSSPTTTLGRDSRGDKNDGQPLTGPLLHAGHSTTSSQQGAFLPMPSTASAANGNGSIFGVLHAQETEAREMTPLDRVFLEQSHEGRKDVEGDDVHLYNEIQRQLQSRVQSQLMEATNRNASTGSGGGGGGGGGGAGGGAVGGGRGSGGSSVTSARSRGINNFGVGVHQSTIQGLSGSPAFVDHEMELINNERDCYMTDSVLGDPVSDPSAFITVAPLARRCGGCGSGGGSGGSNGCVSAQQSSGTVPAGYASPVQMTIGGATDLLDDPDNVGSAGVPPVSPSSNGGPAQGLVLDVGSSVDFLLDSADSAPRGSAREARNSSPDVEMEEASGEGQLREVVNGLDAMDLDDVENALALLTARKQRIIAKQHAGAAAAAAAHAEAQAVAILVPPQPPPPLSSNSTGASTGGTTSSGSRSGSGGGRQRRSSGRSRHGGGEGQSPSAGGRSEAFGISGGGVRGAPVSFSRAPRGQGRPPPVPGHLSASTAAMLRSSPGNIASLAELDSYLEHHHRRLVEQVEGGVLTDDVEAEIKASRHQRQGTRSHQGLGTTDGSSNGLGSSSSSSGVPRTVGARVSTAPFFHSTLSADGDHPNNHHNHHHRDWNGRGRDGGRQGLKGDHPLSSNGVDNGEWDPPQKRGPYKRERGEPCEDSGDGGWGIHLRGFRGGGSDRGGGSNGGEERDGGDRGQAFMGVSGSTHTHSQTSSPPSIMSSDDVSASSSFGNNPVMVLPTSPNNVTFAGGRPPPSLARIRLEAVRSPVVRHGRAPRGRGGSEDGGGGGGGSGGSGGGPVFTSPDASKHVQELCSPRSAFTPRSASSISSLTSSPARRR